MKEYRPERIEVGAVMDSLLAKLSSVEQKLMTKTFKNCASKDKKVIDASAVMFSQEHVRGKGSVDYLESLEKAVTEKSKDKKRRIYASPLRTKLTEIDKTTDVKRLKGQQYDEQKHSIESNHGRPVRVRERCRLLLDFEC